MVTGIVVIDLSTLMGSELHPMHMKIGPLSVTGNLPASMGAERFDATTAEGHRAQVWLWPAQSLKSLGIDSLAHLIESLQGVHHIGLTDIVHGSIAPDHAVVAFARPRGVTLSAHVRRSAMSAIEAIASATVVLDALTAAQELGFRVGWWTTDTLWVLDRGPAWVLAAPGLCWAQRLPSQDNISDIAFRAPEMADRSASLLNASNPEHAAVEAYALGATLFFALCGKFPFNALTVDAYIAEQKERSPSSILQYREDVKQHRQLISLIDQCLDREPARRPQTLDTMRQLLEQAERHARRLDTQVDFLPARVRDTQQVLHSDRREVETSADEQEPSNRLVPMIALVALVAILLFLVGRTAGAATLSTHANDPHEGVYHDRVEVPSSVELDGDDGPLKRVNESAVYAHPSTNVETP